MGQKSQLFDPLRREEVTMTPEEQVRQWFIGLLRDRMKVPVHLMKSEVRMMLGGKVWRADILVYGHNGENLAVVECKRPDVKITEKVCDQALRYNSVLNVRFIFLTNGISTFAFCRDGNGFRRMDSLPSFDEMAGHMGCMQKEIFHIVSQVAQERGVRAFVIGGFVRDCFLGRECNDIDIVVEGSGIDFAKAVGEKTGKYVSYFKNFGTAMLHYRGDEIEFVGARKESYRRESRKPIVENGTLEDDQMRRDFTINAMAFSLQKSSFGELVDPFGGIRDLSEGIIRTPLDPDTTYSDDPLRMLRAVRFATKLSTPERTFSIVPESMESMRRMASRLEILSMERITEELNKMLVTARPSMALRLMEEAGLLKYILPELCALKGVETVEGRGHKENFSHTLMVLDNLAAAEKAAGKQPKLPLRWAALLHDIGKPASKKYSSEAGWSFHGHEIIGSHMVPKIFNRLKLPVDEGKYVKKLVWLHLRPISLVDEEVTDSAVRRLLFDAGDDIDDLMMLCRADVTSKNPAKVAKVQANFSLVEQKLIDVEAKDRIRNFKNPITGEYVMEVYGIPPCKEIGILKEYVKEAILDGVIPNEFEAADALMRMKASEVGLVEKS